MALATVLMCTNTYDEYVLASIASVKSQNLPEVNFLLIANSVDDVAYKKLFDLMTGSQEKIYRTEISGLTFSLNLGLHLTATKYVIRMDSDDICYSMRISEQINYMEKNSSVVVCGAGYNLIDGNNQILKTVLLPQSNKSIRKALYWGNPICHPTVILRRDAVLKVGGYSGEKSEDYELWLKLSANSSNKFFNIDKALIGYRTAINSKARNSRVAYINVLLAQKRMFFSTLNPLWLISSLYTFFKLLIRSSLR
jgi:glycosyltransferase involved in cell wall biosynthesis